MEALYDLVMSHNLGSADVTRSVAAVDVTPKGVDKSFGLGRMLARHDTAWSAVLGIDDSWNDLPMLNAAGLGAAPVGEVEQGGHKP